MMVPKFHPYATDSKEREQLPVWIAILAIVISYGLHIAVDHFYPRLPWYVDLWSPVALYGIIYGMFDRHAWRWHVWRQIGLVTIPDLNGHYAGSMTSSYDNHQVSRPCEFDINQTWTTIAVRGQFERSSSFNMITGVSVLDTVLPRLTYEYYNVPADAAPPAMHPHDGTMWFDIDGHDLKGNYYTGRGRNTTGTVVVTRMHKSAVAAEHDHTS
jgi:hypothetical protein